MQLISPNKKLLPRPTSPLKPNFAQQASPAKTAAIAATANLASLIDGSAKPSPAKPTKGRPARKPTVTKRGVAGRPKRGEEQPLSEDERRVVSSSSNISLTSSTTTVVRKTVKTTRAAAKADSSNTQNAKGTRTKRVVNPKNEAPISGRRVLRARA